DSVADLSLCHGLAGAVEILRIGSHALGEHWDATAKVGRAGLLSTLDRQYKATRLAPLAEVPGALLGAAGIGFAALAAASPAMPSLVDPTTLASMSSIGG